MRPILVVDDDPAMLRLFSAALHSGGYKTRTAPDAVRPYSELLAEETPAMLITDVRMPGGLDGAMLAQVVAQSWPDIPILVVSGNVAPGKGALPDGAVFLRKPVRPSELLQQVGEMVPQDGGE